MKQGQSLNDLMNTVINVEKSKADFIVPTAKIVFDTTHNTIEFGNNSSYEMTDNFHDQISSKLEIPRQYYNRMRERAPNLLDKNVQHWLVNADDTRMIRTLGPSARAYLSNRYRPLDNYDLMQTILPVIAESQLTVESCELTEKKLYLKVLSPKIEFEVRKNDVVRAGLVISNSEIGGGTLSVEPLIYRLVCLNGLIASDNSMRKYHVGRSGTDYENAIEFYRDETREADDKALWMRVRDTVAGAFNMINFQSIVNKFEIAAGRSQIETIQRADVIEVTRKKLGLSENESSAIEVNYQAANDRTLYGLINAITLHSQSVADYDRATELEKKGGVLLDLNDKEAKTFGFN